ncbi:dihydroxyacetone kinase subunit DhaL [Mycolicibacterium vinylchloridicum]|uniref:dihydroxyacetone kinase subunit DhaL n=1 Tax=Mycolicibacterium vinylchloridicum TaxID=2736928 RepID=UPI002D7F71F7|nr:dihydroxyacetone kinase subunit DhaL [Mycolicibacterium vinylchloridicum]
MAQTLTVDQFGNWLRRFAAAVHDNAALLTELDSAIGDADHGSNMDRGMTAVVALLDETTFSSPDALFKKVGMTLVSTVGGASGPLYGTFFLRLGAALQDVDPVDATAFGAALRAGVQGVQARGKAELDDKTMYDAVAAGVTAYDAAASAGIAAALAACATAAAEGRDRITPLVARKGRASYLGERSAGHQDPGATSATLLLECAAAALS